MITKTLEDRIKQKLGKGKAILIMGARQVGKTTLLHNLFKILTIFRSMDQLLVLAYPRTKRDRLYRGIQRTD